MKKEVRQSFVVALLIAALIVLAFITTRTIKEGLENSSASNLHAYVISLRHENRLKNIEDQQKRVTFPVEIVDAVKGDKLDLSKVENLHGGHYATVPEDYWKRRTVACYMSHINVMKRIKSEGYQGYSIIFEDDYKITTNTFYADVMQIVDTCNTNQYAFDLIILGNKNDNRGAKLVNNIYLLDTHKVFYGAHGYLVNNASVDKIIDAISVIDYEIDVKYSKLGAAGKLNILMIYPYLVVQQPEKFKSDILDTTTETFVSHRISY